jgi:phosphatidylinositol alpha 1,6-mannosyltransferase
LVTTCGRPELIGIDQPAAMQPDTVMQPDTALAEAGTGSRIQSINAQSINVRPVNVRPVNGSSRRLRVALVTESFLPTGNGVTTSVCRTLEHLARRGHDAVVICPGPAPTTFAGAQVISVPSITYRRFPVGLPSSKVIRTLASFAPDIVHLASPFVLGSAGVTAATQLGVPSVAVFQREALISTDVTGSHPRYGATMLQAAAWRWVRRIHEQADLTLAPNSAVLAQLRGREVPRLALWQGGADGGRFSPERRKTAAVAALRARLAPNGELLIGHVGRLTEQAGVERLVALADLPGTRLIVVGDGPHRRSLEQSLRPAEVSFLGDLDGDDLADAYAALDLFVHTDSRWSTDSIACRTVQEAMTSGLPVVAPACGGPLDLVAPGLNGFLYRADDAAGLRAVVATLTADENQRRLMGSAARAGVERRSWQLLGDELIEHYRAVLEQRALAA